MKGFTLIETLIYLAISATIATAFISLAFTVANSQARMREQVQAEETGLYVARIVENALRNHASVNPKDVAPDADIHNVTNSTENSVTKISFMIANQLFSVSIYEK